MHLAQGAMPVSGRLSSSKTDVKIIDFVDTGHSTLLRMWDKRQRGYRSMGYPVSAGSSDLDRTVPGAEFHGLDGGLELVT